MSDLRAAAATWLATRRLAVVVEIVAARGSTPREAGTRMLVAATETCGTVGGGHLELQATYEARDMLASGDAGPRRRRYALGPALGQCCGGAVELRLATLDAAAMRAWPPSPPRFRLQMHGAGHVGRAVARALAPLDVEVDWIDERDGAFTPDFAEGDDDAWPPHIRCQSVDAPEAEVALAAPGTFFLVLTHRHDLDLRISEAVLRRDDFAFFGLIGSRTKRARFEHRLRARGIRPETIERMTCPIGLEAIAGKEPAVIAASVTAQLLVVSSVLEATLDSQRAPAAVDHRD